MPRTPEERAATNRYLTALVRRGHLEEVQPGVYRRPRLPSRADLSVERRRAPRQRTPHNTEENQPVPNFDNPTNRTTQQRLNRAVPFRVDETMEQLGRLRDERPDQFAKLPPRMHIGLGLYEGDQARHADITGGAA